MPSQNEPQLQTPPETPPIVPGPSTSTTVLASPRNQPFSLKMLTPNIKISAGRHLGYQPHAPPYSICIVHPKTRQIWNQATGCIMTVGSNARYHVGTDCIKLKLRDFLSITTYQSQSATREAIVKSTGSVLCPN